jgi:hypothetical protein
VQEIAYSFVWDAGPWILNGATALFSALAAFFFALIMELLGSKDYVLASMAFAFTPIIFINSTNSMDYMWALCFMLGGSYFALVRRPIVAGIFTGIAIGCRITSGIMLIPLSLLLIHGRGGKFRLGDALKLSSVACILGALAFVPVFLRYGTRVLRYGTDFLFLPSFCGPTGHPPMTFVIWRATLAIWGGIGLLGICIAFVSAFRLGLSPRNNSIPRRSITASHIAAWLSAIFLYMVAFLRLPHDAGYLIPIVPFVILLFAQFLIRRIFILVCIMLILSSFIINIGGTGIQLYGPVFSNHFRRVEDIRYIKSIFSTVDRIEDEKIVVISGWLLPKIQGMKHLTELRGTRKRVKFVYLLNRSQLDEYFSKGFSVYYLEGMSDYTFRLHAFDLHENGARPLM